MTQEKQKLSWVGLRQTMAKKAGVTQKEAGEFLQELTKQLTLALQQGDTVRINGLGTFHLQKVAERKSVNVKTGEAIVISGYNKVSFMPTVSVQTGLNTYPTITPANDPLRKLSEQADEIVDILADLGQKPITQAQEEETPQQEASIPEEMPVQEETPVEETQEESPTPRKSIGEPEGIEELAQEPTSIQAGTSGDIVPNEPINPLPIVSIQSPKQEDKKPPFRPWLVAGITMIIFALLLLAGYLFMQHKVEGWVEHLREKTEQVSRIEKEPATPFPPDTTQQDTLHIVADSASDNATPNLTETSAIAAEEQPTDDAPRVYSEFIATERLAKDSRLAWVAKKYYGEKQLWVFIYEANMDRIPNPNVITPGTEIRIPRLPDALRDVHNPDTQRIIHELEEKFLNK